MSEHKHNAVGSASGIVVMPKRVFWPAPHKRRLLFVVVAMVVLIVIAATIVLRVHKNTSQKQRATDSNATMPKAITPSPHNNGQPAQPAQLHNPDAVDGITKLPLSATGKGETGQ